MTTFKKKYIKLGMILDDNHLLLCRRCENQVLFCFFYASRIVFTVFGPVNFPVKAQAQGMSLCAIFIQLLYSVQRNTFCSSESSFWSRENLREAIICDRFGLQ